MPDFTLTPGDQVADTEAVALYASVGWTAYTRDPTLLRQVIDGSSFVVTARSADGELIGLARALSDGGVICYIQDVLVMPDAQGSGVGRALTSAVLRRYEHVRQTILITDDAPGQRAFYEQMGFTEGSEHVPGPLRMFAIIH